MEVKFGFKDELFTKQNKLIQSKKSDIFTKFGQIKVFLTNHIHIFGKWCPSEMKIPFYFLGDSLQKNEMNYLESLTGKLKSTWVICGDCNLAVDVIMIHFVFWSESTKTRITFVSLSQASSSISTCKFSDRKASFCKNKNAK